MALSSAVVDGVTCTLYAVAGPSAPAVPAVPAVPVDPSGPAVSARFPDRAAEASSVPVAASRAALSSA